MRTPRLDRDRQQWIFDYLVQETGKVFHWDEEGRPPPKSVKSHAQISKHLGRIGQRLERVAAEEEAAGHSQTAFELFIGPRPSSRWRSIRCSRPTTRSVTYTAAASPTTKR